MLELLLANAGQVISAERLLERIWGYDSDAETGVVWVYISSLRKRLAGLSANVQIKNLLNFYHLIEDADRLTHMVADHDGHFETKKP